MAVFGLLVGLPRQGQDLRLQGFHFQAGPLVFTIEGGELGHLEDLIIDDDHRGMSIGYREIVRYLQGDLAKDLLPAEIVRVTRQYAKRQRTWFRSRMRRWRHVPAA